MRRSRKRRSRCFLLVGGGGFIGSHVTRQLADAHGENATIRVFGRDSLRVRENLADIGGIEVIQGDVANQGELAAALEQVTDLVYMVHTTVPATSMRDLTFDLETNVPPIIFLSQRLAEMRSVERFIFLSSGGTVYGEPVSREPIGEDHPLQPVSSYGLTKLISEHYVRLCLQGSHVRLYILRPSNMYGERQNLGRPQGAVGHFLKAAARGEPLTLYGDGTTVRDYLYVGDLARAVLQCLEDEDASRGAVRVFNVGSGRGVSLEEMIELLQGVTGRDLPVQRLPARDFDCHYNVLAADAIRRELAWQPRVSLEEGLYKTWRWILRKLR